MKIDLRIEPLPGLGMSMTYYGCISTQQAGGQTMDITKALSELSIPPGNTEADRVLQVYERVMKIYEASVLQYQAAIKAGTAVNGFSTSTSASPDVAIQ